MIRTLRAWRWTPILNGYLLLAGGLLLAPPARAQCPAAASACTPGSAPSSSYAFGMGILNVTLGSINNTTNGVQDGYRDYSCTLATALTEGTDYALSIRTNTNTDENVRVWIDLNNDGTLNSTTELVFSSNAKKVHTGTVRLPVGTTLNTRLRLRVAADYANSPYPMPCSTPLYSQTEDYTVVASANTTPPVAEFVADQTLTCSGCVQFTDQSQNSPTAWRWDFGDNTTSTAQSPRHCYASPGTYSVTLTATNAAGTNGRTRSNYIVYDAAVPVAASCTPNTSAYCCGYGITQFTLGSLSNASANGQAGYEDFTCTSRVQLTEGNTYTLNVTTGPSNPQDTRIWLDLNNDGSFASGELLYQALNRTNPSGTITIPTSAVKGQPLRLRILSDFVGAPASPCADPQLGQAEDYTVTVLANTKPPVAAFTSSYVPTTCVNPVQFTDQSQNSPTAWRWDFGDNTTSTAQNPSHQYLASGTYSVTLTATNVFGQHTLTRASYLTVSVPCVAYCASTGQNANVWLTNVSVTGPAVGFSNPSGADASGYGNYISQTIGLRLGQSYTLATTTNQNFQRTTSMWLDLNRNGIFETSELLINATSAQVSASAFTIPNNASVLGFTRMRVQMRANGNQPQACVLNQPNSETEDYSVRLEVISSTAEAQQLPALSIFPNPTPSGQLHLRLADAAAAGFYTISVHNVLGAQLLTTTRRLHPAADADLDLTTLPRGLYLIRLTDAAGHSAVRRVERQ
ncbi:GEVED domain-containing protein [Hymenobacter chitinivorans]|uniref:Putative secreted protein (Por secretion system target) n=1 Tax=Hymenobacter chitinivorans DSM 11115 TaxID=1121954 RepID=A0A2M9BSX8_9BACT|nr:GEVED domain-containing protein [Hymenobacter chitinivorans]PJJ61054.1 putative secreted protein (Por secretion system target) [Hymenobacter chitinivorans DSM 11115]